MKLPPYRKYKQSGVDALGYVPEHWEVKRGRFCMAVNPRSRRIGNLRDEDEVSFVPMESVGEYGGLQLKQSRVLGDIGSGYTEFDDGDVIVAKITPCFENGKGALAEGLANGAALGTTELHVLRPARALNPRFLFYFSISHFFRSGGEGEMYGAGGQKRVPPEYCENVSVPLPPLNDQLAITRFLDREIEKIDRLVEKKRELVARLQEKRTAVISRTVTRGLAPDNRPALGLHGQPRLDHGVSDFLGDVPHSWSVLPFKRLCKRVDVGIAEAATHAYCDDGVPIVRSTNVRPNTLDTRDVLRVERWFAEKNRSKTLRSGDLVTVRTGYPGTTAVIPPEFDGSQCFTLVMSTMKRDEVPRFFSYLFNSHAGRAYFEAEGWGTAQTNISVPIVQHFPVVHPDTEEQRKIADFLDSEAAKIDTMIAKVEIAVERLREYRTALINSAVTGKVDVRALT